MTAPDLAQFVSDYCQLDELPRDRDLLAQEIADYYVDQYYAELGISEGEIDLAVHQVCEQVKYYLP